MGASQMDRDMRTSTVFGGPPVPDEPDEPHHSIFEPRPVLHNRRASDAFEYKCERVLQIMEEKPTWTLPLPDYRREVYADQLALIRVALREIGV